MNRTKTVLMTSYFIVFNMIAMNIPKKEAIKFPMLNSTGQHKNSDSLESQQLKFIEEKILRSVQEVYALKNNFEVLLQSNLFKTNLEIINSLLRQITITQHELESFIKKSTNLVARQFDCIKFTQRIIMSKRTLETLLTILIKLSDDLIARTNPFASASSVDPEFLKNNSVSKIERTHRNVHILPTINPTLLNILETCAAHYICRRLILSDLKSLALTNRIGYAAAKRELAYIKTKGDMTQLKQLINSAHRPICHNAKYLLAKVISSQAKIITIGDLHGGFQQLCINLKRLRTEENCFEKISKYKLKPEYYLIFTGDIADRGNQGLDTWKYVLNLQKHNPEQVYILRGNHESSKMAKIYGFFGTCINPDQGEINEAFSNLYCANSIKRAFARLFQRLPLAIFLGKMNPANKEVKFGMFCHGGLATQSMDEIKRLLNYCIHNGNNLCSTTCTDKNFMWDDFGTHLSLVINNKKRGIKFLSYNKISAEHYLKRISDQQYVVNFIARGHQHIPGGICILNEIGQQPPWCQLHNKTSHTIAEGSVVTLLSLPPLYQYLQINEFACGIFHTNQAGEWLLTPLITRYDEISKY